MLKYNITLCESMPNNNYLLLPEKGNAGHMKVNQTYKWTFRRSLLTNMSACLQKRNYNLHHGLLDWCLN
jgi:hypothetical protein